MFGFIVTNSLFNNMSGLAPVYYCIDDYFTILTPTNLLGTAPSMSSTFKLSLAPFIFNALAAFDPGNPVNDYNKVLNQ